MTLPALILSPTIQFAALIAGIFLLPALLVLAGGAIGKVSVHLPRSVSRYAADWPLLLVLAAVVIFAAFIFGNIIEDLLEGDPSLAVDRAAYLYLRALRSPGRDTVMIAITELGDSLVVTTLAIAVAVCLGLKKAWRPLAYWLIAIGGGSILNTVIKVALHRQRPIDLYHAGWDAFSFPSGHSTTNAVLYGFLAILLTAEISRGWRRLLVWATACLVLLIAFSRMYLGAHWLSDVVGGLTFGSLWLAGLGILYIRKPVKPVGAARLLGIVIAALVIVGGTHIALNHDMDLKRYEIRAVGSRQG